MKIKAASKTIQDLLQASIDGEIEPILLEASDDMIRYSHCSSGCNVLHWAAGANEIDVMRYLICGRGMDANCRAIKKSKDRTPLHYACRNGAMDAVKFLVEDCSAIVDARAKNGISPFQMAVWKNELKICKYLVHEQGVDPTQLNDFSCGAVHWVGLCPANSDDGTSLLPIVNWLKCFHGIDFTLKQQQGHSPLHKAAWGGHIALIIWLRDHCGLMDDTPDNSGNYAADLADMANTKRHTEVAAFLRRECSPARSRSCAVLGVGLNASLSEIRKAYIAGAKRVHPDVRAHPGVCSHSEATEVSDFNELQHAYEHLTKYGGIGEQSNPSHSLNLMLEVNGSPQTNLQDSDFFQARLLSVLLEYGEKGLELSNIQPKWRQLWPDNPCPWEVNTLKTAGRRRKKGLLLDYVRKHAKDVVDVIYPKKGEVGTLLIPKSCTQKYVKQQSKKCETMY
mmetsp:Transcript_16391/g.24159  ORF Transcript_16391/g.24159 Transcript_16391/m.24159 type:complete len:451 (+) Transcript_16391:240-1592(+)